MKHNIVILLIASLMIVGSGCNYKKQKTPINITEQKPGSIPKQQAEKLPGNTALPSFVLSCGSGCAMTYSPIAVTGTYPELQVKFKVEMFVDEKLTDTYNEIYEFHYNNSDSIARVNLKGGKGNVLKTLMPDAQRSFKEFAEQLANGISNKDTTVKAQQEQIGNTSFSPEVWRWRSEDKTRELTIKILRLTDDSLIAQYCSVYNNGQKLDCDFETNANIKAAFNTDEKAYIGKFKSFFNSDNGVCRIKTTNESLTWKIMNAPDGEFYAPEDCKLAKVPEQKGQRM